MHLNSGLIRQFAIYAILTLAVLPASGQLSPSAKVSLITVYPGEAVYSLWGHSALRIEDPVLGIDIAYNYGTFNFGHPVWFLTRFAYGHLDYMLSLQQYKLADYSWRLENRAMIEQSLRLSPTQRDSLYNFLMQNALPENRAYRYDFLYDNCATRIRDALEHVLGWPLADDESTGVTFRTLVRPYAHRHPILDLSMNIAMGAPADVEASTRDLMFLPLDLATVMAEARMPTGEPLTAPIDTIYGLPAPLPADRTLPWTVIVLCLALAWGLVRTVRDYKSPRRRLIDLILFTVTGLVGLGLAFLGFISVHTVTWPNLHLLWAWPVHAMIIWVRKPWVKVYWSLSAIATLAFLIGMPFWNQGIPGAIVPVALLLALRSTALALVPRTGFEPVLPA